MAVAMTNPNANTQNSVGRPRALETILLGGLVVGICDMLFAFVFYGFVLRAPWLRIFQTVAGGVIGRTSAYEGGVKTFLLGLLLHFVVATGIAAVFFVVAYFLPALIRFPFISGPIYGMIAYVGMNKLIVPLSALGSRPWPPRLSIFLTELIGHACLVGLPLALVARRSARTR